jgi:hypothetical protein
MNSAWSCKMFHGNTKTQKLRSDLSLCMFSLILRLEKVMNKRAFFCFNADFVCLFVSRKVHINCNIISLKNLHLKFALLPVTQIYHKGNVMQQSMFLCIWQWHVTHKMRCCVSTTRRSRECATMLAYTYVASLLVIVFVLFVSKCQLLLSFRDK